MRVLILTMTCGEAHNAMARSLAAGFGKDDEVRIADIYGATGKEAYDRWYLFAVRHFPHTFTMIWNIGRNVSPEKRYRGLAMQGIRRAEETVRKEIESFRPDVVVCTHSQASNTVCWLKIHNKFQGKVYTILHDFSVCPYWEGSVLCDGVFTPHGIMHPSLIARGYREEQLLPLGFPVNPKFERDLPKEEARARLGLGDGFVVLSVNGGAGIGNTLGLVKMFKRAARGKNAVFLAVCGRNERARKRLERFVKKRKLGNVRVYGFVDNVETFMRASDFYFCRGGMGAVSEAMASGLPFAVREDAVAQEAENAVLLSGIGACYRMKRLGDARGIIEKNLADPREGERIRAAFSKVYVRGGVSNIVSYLKKNHENSDLYR